MFNLKKQTPDKPPRIKLSVQENRSADESVILLHGLARTRRSLNTMAKSLAQTYSVISIDYPSQRFTIEQLADAAIGQALKQCSHSKKVHFVTHSMGGILVRQYLSQHHFENLGNTVMLAPPNKGSELVDRLGPLKWFKRINGPAGQQLGTDSGSKPNQLGCANFSVGVIAGNRCLNPISSRIINLPNDGKVAVNRTHLDGCSHHLVVKSSHTFIMNHPDVLKATLHFLQHGEFAAAE